MEEPPSLDDSTFNRDYDDGNDYGDDDDDDDGMQYLGKEFLRPSTIEGDDDDDDDEEEESGGERDDDDSSSRFFVSESSVGASDAESSENLMRLGAGIDESLLFLDQPSVSEEEILLLHITNSQDKGDGILGDNNEDEEEEEGNDSFSRDDSPARSPIQRMSPTQERAFESTQRENNNNSNNNNNESSNSSSHDAIELVGGTDVGVNAAPLGPPTTIGNTTIAHNYNPTYDTPRKERQIPPSAAYSPDNMSLSSYETSSPNRWDNKVELDLSLIRPGTARDASGRPGEGARGDGNGNGNDANVTNLRPKLGHGSHRRNTSFVEMIGNPRERSYPGKSTGATPAANAAAAATASAVAVAAVDADGAGAGDDHSSNSSSSASEAQVQQLGEFLDDLRISSRGQMKESSVPGSNTSFESSILAHRETEVADVLRRKINPPSSGPFAGRYDPKQPAAQHQSPVLSSSVSSRPLFMEYSNDSLVHSGRGPTDSLVMTFSQETEDYSHPLQPTIPAGDGDGDSHRDRIDATKSPRLSPAPTLSLPPLHSTNIPTGRKQPYNRPRRWSGDGSEGKLDPKHSSVAEGADGGARMGVPANANFNANFNANINANINTNANANTNVASNYTKSTIDRSSINELAKQQQEIGLFSQFATGSKDNDGATRRSRRKKQLSYRQIRTRHLRLQESGEDSSSQASSEQSYGNFFQVPIAPSLSQQSLTQPPTEVGSESKPTPTVQSPATPSRMPGQEPMSPSFSGSPYLRHPSSMLWLRDRSLKRSSSMNQNHPGNAHPASVSASGHNASFDDYLMSGGHHRPYPPPPTVSSLPLHGMSPTPWTGTMYHASPTYYVPGPNHHRVYSEAPMFLDPRFNLDPHHLHPQHPPPAIPQFDRPPDNADSQFNEPHQAFFASPVPHPEQANVADQQFFVENLKTQNRNHSQSYDSLLHKSSSGELSSKQDHPEDLEKQDRERRDSYIFGDDSSYSVSEHSSDDSIENERNIHHLHDGTCHDTRVIRHHHLDTINPKFDRSQFLPHTSGIHDNSSKSKYPTFVCPNCNTRQRQFFTVSSAPKHNESAGMFISLGFATYVVASLYIFGLQEGWGKLDCIYFAVITLTTAGLGDLVPTSNGAKIICSIYIYFGVAFIGLLLGSYIASMLDERSYREAVANQIRACPNCTRIRNIRYASERRRADFGHVGNNRVSMERVAQMHASKLHGVSKQTNLSPEKQQMFQSERISASQSMERDKLVLSTTPRSTSGFDSLSPTVHRQLLGSPMTSQILQRQSHTRHVSMDLRRNEMLGATSDLQFNDPTRHRHGSADAYLSQRTGLNISSGRFRHNSADIQIPATVKEGTQSNCDAKDRTTSAPTPQTVEADDDDDDDDNDDDNDESHADGYGHLPPPPPPLSEIPLQHQMEMENDDLTVDEDSEYDSDSIDSEWDLGKKRRKIARREDANYVIMTLREALVNSMVIIAFGCLGFYLIEGFSMVDSWYFTTVLLTSTGYGDIVPKSDGGKLFATVYLLVAGTILLNNMSMISMIPLELRKRRTEAAVISQFGDSLDDDALRELASGPLVQRIHLERHDPRGLDECTREMFALAMMIRLGKVTEHDIKETFAAFRKLDVNNEGVLNSKSIIAGMINKRRRTMNKHNNTNNGRTDSQSQYNGMSQGYGSWMYPVPSYHDESTNKSDSIYGSNDAPNSQRHSMHFSDQTPLLSLSERGLPQYSNRFRSSTSYSVYE